MASALARLTELQELRLYLDGSKIGPGPRRALCSDPEEVEARELQLHGRPYHSALGLCDPGAERGSLGPHLSVAQGNAGAAAVAESLSKLRQLTRLTVGLDHNALGPGLGAVERPYMTLHHKPRSGDPSLGSLFSVKPIPHAEA